MPEAENSDAPQQTTLLLFMNKDLKGRIFKRVVYLTKWFNIDYKSRKENELGYFTLNANPDVSNPDI